MAGDLSALYNVSTSGQNMLHGGICRRADQLSSMDARGRPLGGIMSPAEIGSITGMKPNRADIYDPPKFAHAPHVFTGGYNQSHSAHVYQNCSPSAIKLESLPEHLHVYTGNGSAPQVPNAYGNGYLESPNTHAQNRHPASGKLGYSEWSDPARNQTFPPYPGSTIPPPAHSRFTHGNYVPWEGGQTLGPSQQFSPGYGGYMQPNTPYSYMRASRAQAGLAEISPHVKSEDISNTPTIQEMDAERTIRRARRNRTCFSRQQMERLEEVFGEHRYPDVYRREEIAHELDLKEEVVRVWFKNRRAKVKRDAKEGRSGPVHASFGSGQASVGSVGSASSVSPSDGQPGNFPVALYSSSLGGSGHYRPVHIKPDDGSPQGRPFFPTPYSLSTMPHDARPLQLSQDLPNNNVVKYEQDALGDSLKDKPPYGVLEAPSCDSDEDLEDLDKMEDSDDSHSELVTESIGGSSVE